MRWPRLHHHPSPFPENFAELRAVLPKPDGEIEFRISNTLFIAVLLSLLLHLAVLLWAHLDIKPAKPQASAGESAPIDVSINPGVPLTTPAKTRTAPAAVVPPPEPTPPVPHPHAPHPVSHPVLTTSHPASTAMPASPPLPPQATDMASYVKMMRERNNTQQLDAPSGGEKQGQEDARSAAIQRNLQSLGGGGIFEITRMDADSASFIFRGWDSATWSSPLNQTFYVQSTDSTDIQHAIVRKMIGIIRAKHNGDFQWDSQRLGRVVTLSARPQDNAKLEAFLIKEFFYDIPQNAQIPPPQGRPRMMDGD